ncbi:phospholipase B1, membrane-associated-like isoform X2 [Hyperolius riggenbachi]|uniref:phospholipase B1, membrane-associated-like isoform X2 n=1 Tax=Hyperolius riggenbachi TaxID=752182 RepID=UPI0035A2B949
MLMQISDLWWSQHQASDDGPSKSAIARMEETLLRASQFTESYVGQRLHYSLASISPGPQRNLLDEAKRQVESLKHNLVVSFAEDWKMILIFVTADDPCNYCFQQDYPKERREHQMRELTRALDYLQAQMPKTLVSLVDLTPLSALYLSHPDNADIRRSCECFRDPSDYHKAMLSFSFQYELEKIISSKRYETREDFTVTLHPVLHIVDFTAQNLNMYEVQCSAQETTFLNTHKNSPYLWLKDMMRVEERGPQEREFGSIFPCTDLSPSDEVPTSVHKLRPGDFKVIAALGDSITAGNGGGAAPADVLGVAMEYRGLSWSIGGDEDLTNVTTLTNILRKYNPDIIGFSTGIGSHHLERSQLNRAVPGAKAHHMLEQAERLVTALERMASNGSINYAEDWKLLTIFIGGNDLCGVCNDPIFHSPENFVYRIKQALDYLQQKVPRMFVNLVTMLEIWPLKELYEDRRTSCPPRLMSALCGCVVTSPDDSVEMATLKKINQQYQVKTHQLVETGIYDKTDNFTVVVQPFIEHLEIPRNEEGVPDRSYLAPDCFHFGHKGHTLAARGLWINMFEPVGQKTDSQGLSEDITIFCPPKEDPYLKTAKNSNYEYPTVTLDDVYGSKLDCTERSKSQNPTSVHELRPADITVVAAVGDSMTAGSGVGSKPNDVLDVLQQYRGLSWSIGGDHTLANVTTLPNILLEFNPFITGYSTESGNHEGYNSFYNRAVPGAKAFDMPPQVRSLIDQMKSDKRIKFNSDWKVITMFIGANDLCAVCSDSNVFSAVSYVNNIKEALDMLHEEVPRAFVNLVKTLDIIPLREGVLDSRVDCPTLLTKMLCPCLLNSHDGSNELQMIKDTDVAYQKGLEELINTGRYDTKDDFTVVLQPFFSHILLPYLPNGVPDASYLAPDCFHINQKGHSQLARLLWNNMLEPLGSKTDTLNFQANITLKCPTSAQPFLRTSKNSDYIYPPPPPTPPPITNWGSDLECSDMMLISDSVPTSVHKLRPGDIKVVAALGDSLTAAFGARATSILNVATEWRGVSWSGGGDETLNTVTTLPNILKKFSPNLKGFSTGTGTANQMFNVAVSGAKAEDIPSQAQNLVQKMKESTLINFNEDWKLVTLFIGGNDLCSYCQNKDRYSPENHMKHLDDALDILYRELPRVFVNLVEIMEVEGLRKVSSDSIGCSLLRPGLCSCIINPRDGSPELMEMRKFNKDLQDHLAGLAEKYLRREDFVAVAQPFFRNTVVPVDGTGKADVSYFSKDCFHFHEQGQAEMAIALWNNMLEPVGRKQNFNNFTHDRTKLKCPSNDHPYLFTLKNSGLPEPEEPTTEPPAVTETKKDDDQVPYWSVIVASIGGVVLGCAVVGIAMSMTYKKKARKQQKLGESGVLF